MNTNKESLPTLTVLRYPAAVWVLLFHLQDSLSAYVMYPYLQAHPVFLAIVDHGFLGVTFFFVLSGFILGYNYDRKYRQADFYIARAARVLPVYYLSLAVSLPLLLYTTLKAGEGRTLVEAIPVLFLLQSWVAPIAGLWNGPTWTLSCEAFFYGTFPWANRALGKLASSGRHAFAKCVAAIVIATLLGSALAVLAGIWHWFPDRAVDFVARRAQHYPAYQDGGNTYALKMWIERFPLLRVFEFIVGIATYHLFKASVERRTWTLGEARLAAGCAVVAFAGFLVAAGYLPFVMLLSALLAPACAVLIFAVALLDRCRHASRGESRALRFGVLLGQSSYAVYLLHAPTMAYLLRIFRRAGLINLHAPLLTYGIMAAVAGTVVTAISIGVFEFYEEPARKLVKVNLSKWPLRRRSLSPALDLEMPGSGN